MTTQGQRRRLGWAQNRLSESAELVLSSSLKPELVDKHRDHEETATLTSSSSSERDLSPSPVGRDALGGKTPMQEFPKDATLGTVKNCWGSINASDFHVRGPKYLHNKKKVASASNFVFELRGAELFMTEGRGPQHIARNPHLLEGGKLREKPTFVVNFRLPWGVLVFYYEIPQRFLPYLQVGHQSDPNGEEKRNQLEQALTHMTPADRCVSRFLLADAETKNKKLKFIPGIVQGPWVVKQAVGSKPVIIGNKLPVSYTYQPAQIASNGITKLAPYLECDLDVAATSTARSILSLVKSYTEGLTIDLGFVIQADEEDELPEQMLAGCRLHGPNPQLAPSMPKTSEDA